MGAIQNYLTLAGLLLDIIGVAIVGREWLELLGGGGLMLVRWRKRINVERAERALREREELRTTPPNQRVRRLIRLFLLAIRRSEAKTLDDQVRRARKLNRLDPIPLLDEEGYLD